jgi:hypothetical protein
MKTLTITHMAALAMAALLVQPVPGASKGGAIQGIVTDPSGAAIPGASISISANRVIRTISTDDTGHYSVFRLPAGHYGVEVHSPGFSGFHESGLVVSDGYETEADVQLTVAPLRQRITVTGANQ